MRDFIKDIESNVKGMGSATLGEKTLIVGPTGAGKSSIVEAAQLAMTGGVFGILLRNKVVKKADQLRQLTPIDTNGLFSRASLSNGEISQWSLEPGKKAQRTGPTVAAVTVAQVREAFSGSADRAMFFLHNSCIMPPTKAELLERFADDEILLGAFSHLLFNKRDDERMGLVELQAMAAKRGREEKKEGEFFTKVADLTGEASFQEKGMKHLRHARGWGDVAKKISAQIGHELHDNKVLSTITATAEACLPEGERLVVDLLNGRVGLAWDGAPIFTLSGSQEARALVALAAAMAEMANTEDNGLALLIVEDRMWDSVQLASMMRALTNSESQILITSTIKPKGKTPKGWTLVEVGG